MKTKIKHPMADTISIANDSFACSTEDTSEIAFFLKGKWVTEAIEPFADYYYGGTDTAVYTWVPNELIDAFLDENAI